MKFDKLCESILSEKIENVEDFIVQIETAIKNSFPKSRVNVRIDGLGKESLFIGFSLGKDKSEFSSGILQNDILWTQIWIHNLLPFDPNKKYKVELSVGGSISTKPEEGSYLAYGKEKTGWRNFTATPDNIVKKLDKYFKNTKDILKRLCKEGKISDNNIELVKSKI
jgi:hypothetical protein